MWRQSTAMRWSTGLRKDWACRKSLIRLYKEEDMTSAVIRTELPELNLLHRGKVRDMYGIPGHDDKLLMVATDRISAYDLVMGDLVPGKGRILTELSLFWFDLLADIVPNHLLSAAVEEYPQVCRQYRDQLEGRSMLVRRAEVLPVECIVRGYLSGSFWKAYQQNTTVCGFELPPGLRESDKFPPCGSELRHWPALQEHM